MKKRIGFIGSGHIAQILINSLISKNVVEPGNIFINDKIAELARAKSQELGVNFCASLPEVFSSADYIFMCVRSEHVSAVVDDIARDCSIAGKTIVSISSGIPVSLYRKKLGQVPVARALPNPPSKIGYGAVAVCLENVVEEVARVDIMEMFSSMGDCFALDEEQINIATAVTGPAPVLAFYEAIIESSVLLGIDRATSEKMVYKTLEGCLKMWEKSGDLSQLLVQTSTPAGISVKQNYELEKGCFKATVKKCYEEGYLKTKKFSDTMK